MIKKMVNVLLSLVVTASLSLTAWAAATPSDALVATPSVAQKKYNDVIKFREVSSSESDIMFLSAGDTSDDAAISASFVPYAQVFDSRGAWVANVRGTRNSRYDSSTDYCYEWAFLDDDYHYGALLYNIDKSSNCLPSPGTYGLYWAFANGEILHSFNDAHVFVRSTQNGVSAADASSKCQIDVSDFNFSGWCNVQIGYHTSVVQVVTEISAVNVLQIMVPKKNAVMFTFAKNDGATVVAPDVVAGSGTSDNVTSDTIIDIGSNTASISDTLKELIVHISDQLAALWDQMYAYMHVPHLANDDKNTQLIVDALNGGLTVEVDGIASAAKDITDNADKNTQSQIDNDNKNTDTIVNGFDNSGIESATGQLNGTLDYYVALEGEIINQIDDLGDVGFGVIFDYTPVSDRFNSGGWSAAFLVLQNILQSIYKSMGDYTIAIDLSMICIFATMLVGYWRFRMR